MIGYIENPKIISSFQAQSKLYGKIENRAAHGFIFKISGSAEYLSGGERMRIGAGEMIFLPQGSSYEYTTSPDGENAYTSINFLADIEAASVSVYSMENFYKANYVYESFSELWRFGSVADRYDCMSVFYDLLSYIANYEHQRDAERERYEIIDPAIEYMRAHIYDAAFKVEKLHTLCGISDTYFRRIFKVRFGMTPKEYVSAQRISHARSIIESGDYSGIREVAGMVGFSDPLYFSKAFKRTFGVSPSGIKE